MSLFRDLFALLLLVLPFGTPLEAQLPVDSPQPPPPEILDEPKTIDPTDLLPHQLSVRATQEFSDSSLREVVEWLRSEQNLAVLLDQRSLAAARVSLAEPVSDRLEDSPLYLLLNRLRSLELDWYFEDQVLHITAAEDAEMHLTTRPYKVGDLIDTGYELEDVEAVIRDTIATETWESLGGEGVLHSLGDVMFVRQTNELHRDVRGLLAALRNHARRTFVNDPAEHLALRRKLKDNVNVDFQNTPLEAAIEQLAESADIDVRLDAKQLRSLGIRQREPVTLRLSDRKLETALQAIALDFRLTWTLEDGVLWITTPEASEASLKTAVYDVRDLCRDQDESEALIEAITSQADPSFWDVVGGPSSVRFARPGTMVISSTEGIHNEILQLLESYRLALRSSRPRKRHARDPREVITVYYRLHDNVAQSLAIWLPQLVKRDSWKSVALPEAPGEIIHVASPPDRVSFEGSVVGTSSDSIINRGVLIIRQTRETHDDITEVIRRVKSGDSVWDNGFAGGGFGGGGFGGGFFSVQPRVP